MMYSYAGIRKRGSFLVLPHQQANTSWGTGCIVASQMQGIPSSLNKQLVISIDIYIMLFKYYFIYMDDMNRREENRREGKANTYSISRRDCLGVGIYYQFHYFIVHCFVAACIMNWKISFLYIYRYVCIEDYTFATSDLYIYIQAAYLILFGYSLLIDLQQQSNNSFINVLVLASVMQRQHFRLNEDTIPG